MGPLGIDILLQHITEHVSHWWADWQDFFTHLREADERAIATVLLPYFRQHEMTARLLDDEGMMGYAEHIVGAKYTLLFATRYDAEHPGAGLAIIPMCLTALTTYQGVMGELPANIKWLFGAKSVTERRLNTLINEQPTLLQADGCLWYEEQETALPMNYSPTLILGTKGKLAVELTVQTTQQALQAAYGAIVPNAAWRLVWALGSLKDVHEEVLLEGFYDTLVPLEDTAIEPLYTLPDTAAQLAQQWGLEQLLLGVRGFQAHYAHLVTPTLTLTYVHGGDATRPGQELLPTRAVAQIDFSLVPWQNPHAIFASLQQHLRMQGFPDIETHVLTTSSPAHTSPEDPFVRLVQQASVIAYGRPLLTLPMMAESIPLAPLRRLAGMPVIIIPIPFSMQQLYIIHDQHVENIAGSLRQVAAIITDMPQLSQRSHQ